MSDDTSHENGDFWSDEASSEGLRGADVLAVLAVASLLAAIGLITFYVTTAVAG